MDDDFKILILGALNYLMGESLGADHDAVYYEDWVRRMREYQSKLKPTPNQSE